jgi:hypothetical protein
MMNIIRKYKIHQLVPCLNDKELEIINFVKDKINNLTEYKDDKYPNSLFFMNSGGKYIFELDDENERLFVRYKDFWEVLETNYNLKHDDIQSIIQGMAEIEFRRKVYTSGYVFLSYTKTVEIAFKQCIIPPINTKI